MQYLTLTPSDPLKNAVEMLWAYDGYKPPHRFDRVFPTGTVELLLNLTDGRLCCHDPATGTVRGEWCGLLLAGVHHSYQLVETAQQHSMLGVALRPGGAWRLLGIDADELCDRHVPLENILGTTAAEWGERLLEIRDPLDRLCWLDGALCRRTQRRLNSTVAWAADQLSRFPDTARIGILADEAGISTRRFNECFRRQIGINPKAFARIRRFQDALARLQRRPDTHLSLLAVETGYADQAHMIREFETLSGFTPAQYRSLPRHLVHCVPLQERDQMCPAPPLDTHSPQRC